MFHRLVQCLAFVALLSPFCCCDAVAAEMERTQAPSPASEGCCGDQDADRPAPEKLPHDCPHQTASGSVQTLLASVDPASAIPSPESEAIVPVWSDRSPSLVQRDRGARLSGASERPPPDLTCACAHLCRFLL